MKKVVVTGAGSGIGKEFTKLYLEDGSHVLAVSLVQAELDQLSEDFRFGAPRLQTLQMDLSKPDAAAALLQWCQENDWFPDTLINNAGFACFGDAVDLAPERVANMLELNVITLTMTSMLFGREMKATGPRRHPQRRFDRRDGSVDAVRVLRGQQVVRQHVHLRAGRRAEAVRRHGHLLDSRRDPDKVRSSRWHRHLRR